MFKAVLEDRVLSRLVGLIGLALLWWMMLIIVLAIRLSSDRPAFEPLRLRDNSRRFVLVFSSDGPLGDFLRRSGLLRLPTLLDLGRGRVTMFELLQLNRGR
jgi:hypothetical protein